VYEGEQGEFRVDDAAVERLVAAVRGGAFAEAGRLLEALTGVEDPGRKAIVAGWRERASALRNGTEAPQALALDRVGAGAGALLDAVLQRSSDGIVLNARDSQWILEASDSFCALTGYAREELLGRTSVELGLVDDDEPRAAVLGRAQAGLTGVYETRLRRKHGEVRLVEYSHTFVEGNDLVLTVVRDVTARRQLEDANRRFAAIVEQTDDAVLASSPSGAITEWNRGAERLFGYAAEEAVGQPAAMLIPPERAAQERELLERVLQGEAIPARETVRLHRDGSGVDVSLTCSPIRDEQGAIVGVSSIARDLTERKRLEHELRYHADHDPLTGLYNRRRFSEELTREVAFIARYQDIPAALLLADLDNFKTINDTLGHRAGDELLRGVAAVLGRRLRASDVLARLGGDEFAVLLPHTDLRRARIVAESLRDAVGAFRTVLAGREVSTSASIGVAPIGGELTGEDSLSLADVAMYRAKDRGGDGVVVREQDAHRGPHVARAGVRARLRVALDQERFELHRQPILDVRSGRVERHELLLRLRGERDEILQPRSFIHAAERDGIIADIDRWVLRQAIALLASEPGPDGPILHVNVSAVSVRDRGLLTLVGAGLRQSASDPARLVFELTETTAILDMAAAHGFAGAVARLGCGCALDDFGAGFGSFSSLRHLPVEYVKLDGELVRTLPDDATNCVLVKAMIDAAHRLGIRAIAEHVDSPQTLALLREYGVDYAQGFTIGTPQPRRAGAGR
jgi:diguanylate cyclase (GGDEF)-like protein/PAS domain S-box-containing protein